MSRALAAVLVVGLCVAGAAQDTVNLDRIGPQVGAVVPDFTLPDSTGTERSLRSLLGRKGALLVFSRSADW
ncbi:MAG: hypothetical protein R2708_05535 [Vicinamibacterales bacterium]